MSSTGQTFKPHSRGPGLGNALGMRKTILFPFPTDLVLALAAAVPGFPPCSWDASVKPN